MNIRPLWRRGALVLLLASRSFALVAQTPVTPAEIYAEWCAVCHGDASGRRSPQRPALTFDPFDFTDCSMATGEPDADWAFVIRNGGAAAGLSPDMPEFSALLDREQTGELVRYLRTFCREPGWPSGNLNMVRALFTTKAFPEYELTLRPMVSHGAAIATRVRLDVAYARRIGRKASVEFRLPLETLGWAGGREVGIGDVAAELKYLVHGSERRRHLATVGLEVELPTGSRRWGFGEGTAVIEPFVAAGAAMGSLELQGVLRGLIPVTEFPNEPRRYLSYDASVMRPLNEGPGVWAVGIEFGGVDYTVAVTPQIVMPLSRTGALSAAFGVRVPMNRPLPYADPVTRWVGYILWDFRDPIRSRRGPAVVDPWPEQPR